MPTINPGDVLQVLDNTPVKWARGCFMTVDYVNDDGRVVGYIMKPTQAYVGPSKMPFMAMPDEVYLVGKSSQASK